MPPSWNVKDPAQIAVVIADAAIVPAVVLAQVIGIIAVIDEMIFEQEIPS